MMEPVQSIDEGPQAKNVPIFRQMQLSARNTKWSSIFFVFTSALILYFLIKFQYRSLEKWEPPLSRLP